MEIQDEKDGWLSNSFAVKQEIIDNGDQSSHEDYFQYSLGH